MQNIFKSILYQLLICVSISELILNKDKMIECDLEERLDVNKLRHVKGVIIFEHFGNPDAHARYKFDLSAARKKFGKEKVPAILSLNSKNLHPYLAYSQDTVKLRKFYYENNLIKFNMGVSYFTGD